MPKISVCCAWWGKYKLSLVGPNGDEWFLDVNFDDGFSDYVLDIGCLFSKASANYPQHKRCLMTTEPSFMTTYAAEFIEKLSKYYQALILSPHTPLRSLKQTRVFTFASTWVTWKPKAPTEFGIGGIFSKKTHPKANGYPLRHMIIQNNNKIKIPGIIYSYLSKWRDVSFSYPLKSKEPSLKWMFHLVIENGSEPGYFTEKLIDCLLCECVPLYFGDPDISAVFDERGIIRADPKCLIDQINSLTPKDYDSKSEFIKENKRRAMDQIKIKERIVSVFSEIEK